MARKRLTLAYIANDSSRRAAFRKRQKGFMKKVNELRTLCDVKACAIVYAPHDPSPAVCPSTEEATRVLELLRCMPEAAQSRNMMDQETFLWQQVAKLQEQLRKKALNRQEVETTLLMQEGLAGHLSMDDVQMADVGILARMVEAAATAVDRRIETMKEQAALRAAATEVKEKSPLEAATEMLDGRYWPIDDMSHNEFMFYGGGMCWM